MNKFAEKTISRTILEMVLFNITFIFLDLIKYFDIFSRYCSYH